MEPPCKSTHSKPYNALSYARSFEDLSASDDFLSLPFPVLLRIMAHCKDSHSELGLFKAAWSWVIADVKHVQHLEEILKVVKVPDITFQELIKLGNARSGSLNAANLLAVGGEHQATTAEEAMAAAVAAANMAAAAENEGQQVAAAALAAVQSQHSQEVRWCGLHN